MRRLLLVAVAAWGCGGGTSSKPAPSVAAQPAPEAKSSYSELEARIPKIIAAMDQLAKDLTGVKDDCPKVAAVLRKWGSEFAIELDALWELKNQLTPDEKERYEHEHDDDAQRLKPVFDSAMASCQGHEEVEDALTVAGFRRAESAK